MPIWFLDSSVLMVVRCADLIPVFFDIYGGTLGRSGPVFFDIYGDTLCRSGSCILRCWLWDAVPIWFLYASVLDVGRCADLVPVCFGVGCGVLCRFIFLGIRPAALLVMDCFEAVFCMLRC